MKIYYAQSTHGFYTDEIHGNKIPQDSIEITDEHYHYLLAEQSKGNKIIGLDSNGQPAMVNKPPVSEEDIRETRNSLLSVLDDVVCNPLRWAALSTEKQQEYAVYRQALLDVPQQSGFPTNVVWPVKPQ
jgi:hypothetical protein